MTAKLANANFEHVGDATADSFSSPSRNTGWGFFVRICAWTGKVHIGAAGRDEFSYSPAAILSHCGLCTLCIPAGSDLICRTRASS